MTALAYDSPVTIGLPDAPESGTVLQPDSPVVISVVLEGPQGVPGPAGDFPAGGDQGQVLAKASVADGDVEWVDVEVVGGLEVSVDADGTLIVDGTTVELATDAQLTAHTGNTSNPHSVTKTQVGLGNVDNTSDTSKPVSTLQAAADTAVGSAAASALAAHEADTTNVHGIADTSALATSSSVTTAVGVETSRATAAEALLAPKASPTFTGTVSGVTKSHVGLGNVDNTADTAKPVSTAQQTALDLKAPLASPTFTGTVAGVTKTHVGLSNVDNTADTAKPVSTLQAAADTAVASAAASALSTHEADTTNIHGITDTSALVTTSSAPELIRDTIGTALVAGTNVTITPNDGADTITIAASGGGGGAVATDTIFDAKGDLAVGTGADTASKLTVGTNGYGLVADSTQTTGLRWAVVRAPSIDNLEDFNAVFGSTYTGHDQEFNATSTSLPSGWSWFNQGTSTYTERFGAGTSICQAASTAWRGITQSVSGAPSTFDVYAKITASQESGQEWGVLISDGTVAYVFDRAQAGSGGSDYNQARLAKWSNPTTFSSVVNDTLVFLDRGPTYFRVRKNSSTSYDYFVSADGRAWSQICAAVNPGITPTLIGLASGGGQVSCEWWRMR